MPYTKSSVGLLKANFLVELIRWVGQANFHKSIQDLGWWVPHTYPTLDPKMS